MGKQTVQAPRWKAGNKVSIAKATANGRPEIVPGYLTEHLLVGSVPSLGAVLTNGYGKTLYAFERDQRQAVTCTGACTRVWRPFRVTPQQGLDSSPLLSTSSIGAMRDPEGGNVVTFAGWPLYTFAGDARAGVARGQGLYSYGGRWYTLARSGVLKSGTR